MSKIGGENYSPFWFKSLFDPFGNFCPGGKPDDIALSIGIVSNLEPNSDEKDQLVGSLKKKMALNDEWLISSVGSLIEDKITKGVFKI
jgi:hypothetical protein